MHKFTKWYLVGIVTPILAINLCSILSTQYRPTKTSSNTDSGKCFLVGRRECQIIITAIPSPSPAEGGRSPLPSTIGLTFPGEGRTSTTLIEVAND